jgi:hypothetical protein
MTSDAVTPRARADEMIVRDMDGEVLIYDLRKDEAVTLNAFAGSVWRACDGAASVSAIIERLQKRSSGEIITEHAVWQALDMLSKCDLLEGRLVVPAYRSRRELARALGLTVAVPVVAMIAVPTPAQAATCLPNGHPCMTTTQCCDNCCSPFGGFCSNNQNPNPMCL